MVYILWSEILLETNVARHINFLFEKGVGGMKGSRVIFANSNYAESINVKVSYTTFVLNSFSANMECSFVSCLNCNCIGAIGCMLSKKATRVIVCPSSEEWKRFLRCFPPPAPLKTERSWARRLAVRLKLHTKVCLLFLYISLQNNSVQHTEVTGHIRFLLFLIFG